MVYSQLFWALAARSRTYTLGQLGFFTNPWLLFAVAISSVLQLVIAFTPVLRTPLKLVAHGPMEVLFVLVLALIPVTLFEVSKLVRRRFAHNRVTP
jgi:Ca2+-transporting ATPase